MEDKLFKHIFHDILDKVLSLSDEPAQCADYLTRQINELVGAKSVLIAVQREIDSPVILSVYPSNQQEWANHPAIHKLIDISIQNNEIQFWNNALNNEHVVTCLMQLEIEKAIAIPLIAADSIIGSILLLGITHINGNDEMMKSLYKLSGVLALIIRNSRLNNSLENLAESRTAELIKRNEKLAESETKYRNLVENSPDAIAIYNSKEILLINNECLKLMRATTTDQLLGKNVIEFVHPDYRDFVIERMTKALTGEIVLPLAEEKFIRLDGTTCDVDVKAIPITFDGKPAVQLIIRDITERKQLEVKIQQISDYYQTLIEKAPDGFVLLDRNGQFKYVSPSARKIFGYGETETINHNPNELTYPDDLKMVQLNLKKIIDNPDFKPTIQYRLRHKNGHYIWVESIFNNLYDDSSIDALLINFRDVTDNKMAEDLIVRSKDRLNRAEFASKSGNWEMYLDTMTIKASKGANKLYGLYKDEFTYDRVRVIPLPEYRAFMDESLKNLVENGVPYDIDFKIKTADTGEIRDIHSTATYDKEKRILFGIIQDVTFQKEAAEQLRESEEKFRTITEQSTDLISITDEKGIVTYASPAVRTLFLIEPEEMCGKSFVNFLDEKDIPKAISAFKMGTELNQHPKSLELMMRRKDGTLFDGELDGANYKFKDQRGTLVVIRDISERKETEKAIRDSENFFRIVFEQSVLGKVISSVNSKILKANKAFADMLGYTIDEIEQLSFVDLTYPDDRPATKKAIQFLLTSKQETHRLEKQYIHKNGNIVWADVHSVLYRNEDGTPNYFISSVLNITERKITEKALKESEELFRKAFLTSPDCVNVNKLEDGVYVMANEGFTSILGYSQDEAIGKSSLELNVWVSADDRKKWVEEINNKGFVENFGTQFRTKGGELLYCLVSASLVEIAGIKHIISITRNITKMKQIEESLRESEELYRTLVLRIPDGVYKSTPTGKFIEVNPALVKMLGYESKEELLNLDIKNQLYFMPEDRDQALSNEKNRPISVLKLKKKDGSEIWLEDNCWYNRDENGEVIYNEGVLRDITERKLAEDELKKSFSLLHASIESTADGILVVDTEGKTTLFNQKFAEMWEIPKELLESGFDEQLLRYVVTKLVDPDNFLEKVTELYKNVELSSVDNVKLSDGRTFIRYSIPQRIGNEIVGRVWSFHDITDRLIIENSLIEKMNDMTRLHNLTIDREMTMIELKKEVNQLLNKAGKEEKYRIVE